MSLKLNSSGGGSITLQEPSTASNRTLTLPDNSGTVVSTASTGVVSQTMLASGVAGNGPAFSAYLSTNSGSITASTFTKIQFNIEEFDTNNNYDNATNYRFTPTVAGYYQISGACQMGGAVNTTSAMVSIYKNGSRFKDGVLSRDSAGVGNLTCTVSTVIYFNGSTDYVELYGLLTGSGTLTFAGAQNFTYFSAALVRAA